MVFRDLLINSKQTSKERLAFLKKHLDQLEEGEKVVFLGDTLAVDDLNLSFLIGLIKFLNRYDKMTFYIQEASGLEDAWLRLPNWPSHVKIFEKESDVELVFDEFSHLIMFEETPNPLSPSGVNGLKGPGIDIQLIKQIEQTHFEHKDDIVGAFINEVKSNQLDPLVEASVIKIGLDALLRR